jgi:beta-glucanase (GH16 family)
MRTVGNVLDNKRLLAGALVLLVLAAGTVRGDQRVVLTGAGTVARQPRPVWSDEFDGRAGALPNRDKWQIIYGGGGFGNEELQYYTDSRANVALSGRGALVITARRQRFTGTDGVTRLYTSAALQTKGLFQTRFGRVQARIKIPSGKGLWPAFWAIGSDIDRVGWPQSGEIDMMENLGNQPFTLLGSIHGPETGARRGYALTAARHTTRPLSAGYHVYGVDWSPNRLVFTLDGVPYATQTPATLPRGSRWVFNRPFFLILNLAVGGSWPGAPDGSTRLPARMLVDWVRVYTRP